MKKRTGDPHVHSDHEVDLARVRAFADAPPEVRLQALTELRRRVSDDSTSIELGLGGGLIGLIVSFLLPAGLPGIPETTWVADLVVRLVFSFIVGVAFVVALLPGIIPMARRSRRREVADVWLRAYEDELSVRWGRDDRAARRWRRAQVG